MVWILLTVAVAGLSVDMFATPAAAEVKRNFEQTCAGMGKAFGPGQP